MVLSNRLHQFSNNCIDLRKWAVEGLAYLTLDADVKEDLVADTPALRSLMDLAKVIYTSFIILTLSSGRK